jgi:hypothetical protein
MKINIPKNIDYNKYKSDSGMITKKWGGFYIY